MPVDSHHDSSAGDLEGFRDYLRLLARLQVDRALEGKIDLSGVVQQSLFEASRAPGRPRDPDEMTAWLRRILVNNLTDELRKLRTRKRDVGREVSLDAAIETSSLRLEAWLVADQSSPSHGVHREEESVRLARALAELPETQREAIVLRHLRGESLAAIAERLGRSPASVAGLLKRGLRRLRELLPESVG